MSNVGAHRRRTVQAASRGAHEAASSASRRRSGSIFAIHRLEKSELEALEALEREQGAVQQAEYLQTLPKMLYVAPMWLVGQTRGLLGQRWMVAVIDATNEASAKERYFEKGSCKRLMQLQHTKYVDDWFETVS